MSNSKNSVKTLRIHCAEPWFSFVKSGEKPIEGRMFKEKYKDFKTGDKLIFWLDENNEFETEVVEIKKYKTLMDYLTGNKLSEILPTVKTVEEGRQIYTKFNSEENITKTGFLGIRVKVTNITKQ